MKKQTSYCLALVYGRYYIEMYTVKKLYGMLQVTIYCYPVYISTYMTIYLGSRGCILKANTLLL